MKDEDYEIKYLKNVGVLENDGDFDNNLEKLIQQNYLSVYLLTGLITSRLKTEKKTRFFLQDTSQYKTKTKGWNDHALPHHTSAKHPAPSLTSSTREALSTSQESWARPTVSGM